ncbi:MAG TPA: DUF5658 family protein [Patescibacteria group bacterium]|nr:DUF5658 family protein [Patescibacteria group bacterium]
MPKPVRKPWTPPDRRVLILTCAIVFLLNVFDAVSTLEIVRRGGGEANPIASPMLQFGDAAFFFWKMGLASACVAALAVIARKRRFAWLALRCVTAIYAVLAAIHAYLLWFLSRPC